MKKFQLDSLTSFQENIFVFGIASSEPDYKLSWLLNTRLGTKLVKSDDFKYLNKNKLEEVYSIYCEIDAENEMAVYLLVNKGIQTYFLEKLRNIDFLFVVKGQDIEKTTSNFTSKLKAIDVISLVVLDNSALKTSMDKLKKLS